MLNMNSLMVGTDQLKVMADFYEKVFGKAPDMNDGEYRGWLVGSCFFTVATHSEVKGEAKEPQRIIINIETKEVKEEFSRISAIEGAKVIKAPYQMGPEKDGMGAWIATLADPDGNYFQLITPWDDMKK